MTTSADKNDDANNIIGEFSNDNYIRRDNSITEEEVRALNPTEPNGAHNTLHKVVSDDEKRKNNKLNLGLSNNMRLSLIHI